MTEYKSQEHAGKAHKPAANHPWRKGLKSEVVEWAKEQSTNAYVNNYKKGGGKPQK